MIPQDTIEQIRQAIDIVQILGQYLKLRKRGRNYQALCPFHTEKTPSFSVSQDKQIYHCFGCGKGGNVFTFLMEHESMTFVEAANMLAQKAGIKIKEDPKADYRREQSEKLAFANQVAVEYFQSLLASSKYKNIVDAYLRHRRKINDESIKHFQLGLAGDEWDGLIKFAEKKDLSPAELEKAGLANFSDKNKSHYDRFRHRLMFPIFNLSQKPIAFGGRTLKKGEMAKYVNSPETPLYIKGHVLYGLNSARDAIRKSNSVYVVEGYFDVISLWQTGIHNVVASSGTAFTPQQARLLARFAETVYLFFDADSAGQQAALRSVDSLYDAGLEVKIVVPPSGEDPDSIAAEFGRDRIDDLTFEAVDFITFRLRDVEVHKQGIIGKEKLVKEFSALARKITDATRRALFYAESADALGVNVDMIKMAETSRPSGRHSADTPPRKHNAIEAGFLSLLFCNPGAIDAMLEAISPDDFDSKRLSRLYAAVIQQYKTHSVIDAVSLVNTFDEPELKSLVTELASTEMDPANVDSVAREYMTEFDRMKKKRVIEKLSRELAEAEANGENDKATRLLAEIKSRKSDA